MKKITFKTLGEAELHANENYTGQWKTYYYDKKRYDGLTERYEYSWKEYKMEYAGSLYRSIICSSCEKELGGLLIDINLSKSFCVYCGYDRSKPTKPDIDREYVHYLSEESEK